MEKRYYRRTYKRLFLQERDLEMFEYCLEQKFLTVDQMTRRFFKVGEWVKDKRQAAYRRSLILQRFKMMELVPALTGKKVVRVTRIGAGELGNRGREHLGPSSLDYRTFEHDRRVTDCRIALESLKLVTSWTSERYLKSRYVTDSRVPDAVMVLKNGQRAALEVEIARKGIDRYRRILSEYLERRFGKIDLLFYVCNTIRQIENLSKLTRDYRWVYFVLYHELMANPRKALFNNHTDQFSLGELQ